MPNAKDPTAQGYERIMLIGPTGSGKTTQMWSLPGKKFAYIFDPNALRSLQGLDVDYELFLSDLTDFDPTLPQFYKGSRAAPKGAPATQPTAYMKWGEDLNQKVESGFFNNYDWLCFDSLTLLAKTIFDLQLWIAKREGGIEDLADYRIVGNKLSQAFRRITSLPINIYCTGHIQAYQDDKTKKIVTQIALPGSARAQLPLLFSNIWLAFYSDAKWKIRTVPEERGFKEIRSSVKGLPAEVDVTITDWTHPERAGIGALLTKQKKEAA